MIFKDQIILDVFSLPLHSPCTMLHILRRANILCKAGSSRFQGKRDLFLSLGQLEALNRTMACPALDLTESCSRLNWASYFPFALVCFYLVVYSARAVAAYRDRPLFNSVNYHKFKQLFTPWLSLDEALALNRGASETPSELQPRHNHWQSSYLIPGLSLVEVGRLSYMTYQILTS